MAGALVPTNGLSSLGSPQQGSVDWVQLSKSSLTLSIEILSRLSRAGIETLTVAMGQAICSPFNISGDVQRKIQLAVEKLKARPSYGDVLWFGFGLKSIVRLLMETEQGLLCVTICGCLSLSYDEYFAAQPLRDMAHLRAAPNSLTPSMGQWIALIKVCAGILTASNFPNMVEGFSRLWWVSPYNGKIEIMKGPTSSKALSSALYALANVSNGRIVSVTLAGGPDCAWLAAVAEWLLCLRMDIVDTQGQQIYRNFDDATGELPQVRIIRDNDFARPDYLLDQAYLVPCGNPIWKMNLEKGDRIVSHGRSSWSTIFNDTFGSSFQRCFASQDAVAQFCGLLSNSLTDRLGLLSFALKQFPELGKFLELSLDAFTAKDPTPVTPRAFSTICGCSDCFFTVDDLPGYFKSDYAGTCLYSLAVTIARYVRFVRMCTFDTHVQPSSDGLGLLYFHTHSLNRTKHRQSTWNIDSIPKILQYISGNLNYDMSSSREITALSRSGLTLYLLGFEDPDMRPEMQSTVRVIPGYMERNQWVIEEVHDLSDRTGTRMEDDEIVFPLFHVDSFDKKYDHCRRNAPLELLVKEAKQARKIQASYIWRSPITELTAPKIYGEVACRTVVAFGLARLRMILLSNESRRPCQQKHCIVLIESWSFEGTCHSVCHQIQEVSVRLGLLSHLPQRDHFILVRERELREPYSFETSSPKTRIQLSRQLRMLYILLCNLPGLMKASLVETEDCFLCAAGWRSDKIVVDDDPTSISAGSFSAQKSLQMEIDFDSEATSHIANGDTAIHSSNGEPVVDSSNGEPALMNLKRMGARKLPSEIV